MSVTPADDSIARNFLAQMQERVAAAAKAGEPFVFADGEREFLGILCEIAQQNGMPERMETLARQLGLLP